MPSELEIKNGAIVLDMLNQIDGVSFEQVREDIFTVTEYDTGMDLTSVIDVEETTVINMIEICNVPEAGLNISLSKLLLEANNSAVHGAFAVTPDGKIIIKDVLEIENLDTNELESSIANVLELAAENIEKIVEAVRV
jgi:hypothetical protein